MLDFVYLIPAFPLVGFLLLLSVGKRLGDPKAGWIGFGAVAGSFVATLITWLGLLTHQEEFRSYTKTAFDWMHVGSLQVDVAFLVDPLSMVMALFITGVSSLIHLYSIGYMKNDERFHQFFTYLNLFVFSMLILILADNYLLMFLGWEGVGASSYFLVGFWFERDSAATAAKKAFIVNRIGDVGLLLAMFVTFNAIGTLTFYQGGAGVLEQAGFISGGTVTAIAILLFVGAVGKSAQIPLHVWLPDAMEGPTPVSALIHAATMVTAGVYLMVRSAPLLDLSVGALQVVAIVGAASALFAATVACAQTDIKRVLAYSTMSQLGYMFLAVGAGAYGIGIFHMVTHAFFKALLFLSAGAVIHALHDEQNLKKMGGLRRYLPITYWAFLIGWLAISGIPPFAGFWSKDEVLVSTWERGGLLYHVLWGVAMLTVLLTAYYMSRLFFMTFSGKARWTSAKSSHQKKSGVVVEHEEHLHDAPTTMAIPLTVLAFLSVVGGLLNAPFSPFKEVLENFLDPLLGQFHGARETVNEASKVFLDGMSVFFGLLGIGLAYLVSRKSPSWPEKLEPVPLARAWFVDSLYSLLFEKPGRILSNWSAFIFDNRVVDGVVNGSARTVEIAGAGLRRLQTGYVRNYALSVALGTALLLAWVVIRSAQ